jgi:hypothetical protein
VNHIEDRDLQLKHVAQVGDDRYFISTIKMDVRHSWLNQHQNVNVYETMVFAKKDGKVQYHNSIYHKRYPSHDEAVTGHNNIVENIANIINACTECREKLATHS